MSEPGEKEEKKVHSYSMDLGEKGKVTLSVSVSGASFSEYLGDWNGSDVNMVVDWARKILDEHYNCFDPSDEEGDEDIIIIRGRRKR